MAVKACRHLAEVAQAMEQGRYAPLWKRCKPVKRTSRSLLFPQNSSMVPQSPAEASYRLLSETENKVL